MSQRLRTVFLCLLTTLIIVGCSVSTKLILTTGKSRPSILPEDVKIYENENKVQGEYEEIGLITSRGNYESTDLADMYISMREEAAKVGANGLILGTIEEPSTGDKIANHFVPIRADRTGKATAIFVFPSEGKK